MPSSATRWEEHAQAAETALGQGDTALARHELSCAMQALGAQQLASVERTISRDEHEDGEDDAELWLSDLQAAVHQAEVQSEFMQESRRRTERAGSWEGSEAVSGTDAEGQPMRGYAQATGREGIISIIEDLGIVDNGETADLVVSLLEDVELEIEQGETREQMIENVLEGALDQTTQLRRLAEQGMGEEGGGGGSATLTVTEAVPLVLSAWGAADQTLGALSSDPEAPEVLADASGGGMGASAATETPHRMRSNKKKGVNRWVQAKRHEMTSDQSVPKAPKEQQGLGVASAAKGHQGAHGEIGALDEVNLSKQVSGQSLHQGVAGFTKKTEDEARPVLGRDQGEKGNGHYDGVCSFWGVDRLDLPLERRYKGQLSATISKQVEEIRQRNLIEGRVSLLASREQQVRKAVEHLCARASRAGQQRTGLRGGNRGMEDAVMVDALSSAVVRRDPGLLRLASDELLGDSDLQLDGAKESLSRSGEDSPVYELMLQEHNDLLSLAQASGFAGAEAGIHRSMASVSAALRLAPEALRHWRQARDEGEKLRDARAQIRALIGEAETLCGCLDFPAAERSLEVAQKLAIKERKTLEEEDSMTVLRAHAQVLDAHVRWALRQGEQSVRQQQFERAQQEYTVAASSAARALNFVRDLQLKHDARAVLSGKPRDRARVKSLLVGEGGNGAGDGLKTGPKSSSGTASSGADGMATGLLGQDLAAQVDENNASLLAKMHRRLHNSCTKCPINGMLTCRLRIRRSEKGGRTHVCCCGCRLSKQRYRSLAACACCLMNAGEMSSAIAKWSEVEEVLTCLGRPAQVLEGRVAMLENLSLAHRVLGSENEAETFAKQARCLRTRLDGSYPTQGEALGDGAGPQAAMGGAGNKKSRACAVS